ncbi:hypothetical protein AYO44_12890 [Planctomycetaceae bacterium SCGC AG-212-F19]|nr:hypothetical protein AYO44_12890 [Planctomycetaceae bacterium SCGC AG-212-F19]
MGHAIPGSGTFAEVFKWLEEDAPKRRALAQRYPGMRIRGAPSGDEWSKVLLTEGKLRLEAKETHYSGLMLLRGCPVRYYGLPASAEALKIAVDWDGKPDKSWEEERRARQRRFAYGKALGLTRWVTGCAPHDRVPGSAGTEPLNQRAIAKEALQLWEQFLKDGKDPLAVEQAKKYLPELRKLAGAE